MAKGEAESGLKFCIIIISISLFTCISLPGLPGRSMEPLVVMWAAKPVVLISARQTQRRPPTPERHCRTWEGFGGYTKFGEGLCRCEKIIISLSPLRFGLARRATASGVVLMELPPGAYLLHLFVALRLLDFSWARSLPELATTCLSLGRIGRFAFPSAHGARYLSLYSRKVAFHEAALESEGLSRFSQAAPNLLAVLCCCP